MADEPTENQQINDFVCGLRQLREEAGKPSLRAMARTAHYSHTALSSVVAGGRLASLNLTLAFVRACGGDEQAWQARWQQVHDRISAETVETPAAPPARLAARRHRPWIAALSVAGIAAAAIAAYTAMTCGPAAAPAHRFRAVAQAGATCPSRRDPNDHPLIACDDDRFVADVTIPDGTTVRANQTFDKVWEIQNTGLVPWRGRYLQRQGILQGHGICTSAPRVPVPVTMPGADAKISVIFTAPNLPGSCRVDWKMTDGKGRLYFPDRTGLYVIVNVTG